MNNDEIIIAGSFHSIRGELFKRIFLFIIYSIIFFVTFIYKKSFYSDYKITSTSKFLIDNILKFNFTDTLPLLIIILIFIFLVLFTFSSLIKTIILLYNLKRKLTVDFLQGKIINVNYSFPFFKNVEQNKFDNIITVNIDQTFIDRFCNTGNLHIEYLVSGKVDSILISLEVPYVYRPLKVLKELLR